MNEKCSYLNFIKEKGRNISEINPGSDEIGLKVNDALKGIELLKNERVPILGGDILSDETGELAYTYENWYCDQNPDENQFDYVDRSYEYAMNYLSNIAKKNKNDLYVVIVV